MTWEVQSSEESADARYKTAHLNDAVSDDEACDGCAHSETQGDNAGDAAEGIHFGQDEFHWQHFAADKTEYHAYATAKHTKCCPYMSDGLPYKGCRYARSSLVNEPVACISYQP